jgi:hypothetical protein
MSLIVTFLSIFEFPCIFLSLSFTLSLYLPLRAISYSFRSLYLFHFLSQLTLPCNPSLLLLSIKLASGTSRWESSSYARGAGRVPDPRPPETHNWGAPRPGQGRGVGGDRWEASDLPGMGGPAPALIARGPSGSSLAAGPDLVASRKFPERTPNSGVAESWRSSGTGVQGDAPMPKSVSGFTSSAPGTTNLSPFRCTFEAVTHDAVTLSLFRLLVYLSLPPPSS